ncbi:hypothetical protein [Chenggangzhangella methanolivorans]|uniref:DUF2141 domain-containing protein n=1 Tax=Chenggangzhangella methanolivorans TaxID=1437009 RepID=A0A9E6UR43_9HYPH|nr:hypothetical protein [Chenggangzhangella methanolivorans]QZO01850.1 hypothetical protein K6K41_11135 [Chenggangzhangella methanolivorans]
MSRIATILVACAAVTAAPTTLRAFEFDGRKNVTLETSDGDTVAVGSITFSKAAEGATFAVAMDQGRFKDFFLSMREFKCLEGKEILCHVPYPYANPRTVAADKLGWLEASLIFMFKTPAQFGATLANGLVYELKDESEALVGTPRLVDLNEIAAPPDDASRPPFPPDDRLDVEPGSRWGARLVIR